MKMTSGSDEIVRKHCVPQQPPSAWTKAFDSTSFSHLTVYTSMKIVCYHGP